jgi:hypothetical protein
VREKYFLNLSVEVALLLLCLKEYGKVSGLIDCWRIKGVMVAERKDLGEAKRLMESRDVEGLKKHFGLLNRGMLNCIQALKASLIRELEKIPSKMDVLIDIKY